jgi:ubiquinone biosynthesis protein
MKHGFMELAGSVARRMRPSRPDHEAASRPRRFRMALEELGPTFVKFGQLLSTRPDLVGPEYIAELRQLQDRVGPVSAQVVRQTIHHELGKPVEELFAAFDDVPLAAASIAQVHRARARDGSLLAVKVRRPGMVATVHEECRILESLAGWVKSSLSADETIDPVALVRELTGALEGEVHLTREMRSQQRFERMFAADPTVHVPRTFEPLSCDGVLTMEYIAGVKPSSASALRAAGLDARLVARRGVNFVLKQVFDFGLFHTDPHPGNFLVMPGSVLAPLDFGQIARLTDDDRRLMGELVRAIVDRDARPLVRAFERMDLAGEATDPARLTAEIDDIIAVYHDTPLARVPLGRMMMQTFDVVRRNRVRPPASFTLMLKAVATIEALAKGLDSDFELIEHLRPYARRLSMQDFEPRTVLGRLRQMVQDAGELAAHVGDDFNAIVRKLRKGQFQLHVQHEHLEQLVSTLDKASNRVSFALIIAGLLIASSMLVAQRGTVLGLVALQALGVVGYMIATVLGLWLLWSIIRSRKL